METGKKPHSRQKTVGSGSANLGKGQQVHMGSGPVGGSSRPGAPSGNRSARRGIIPGVNLNLKTILIIAAVIIVLSLVFKKSGGLFSGYEDSEGLYYEDSSVQSSSLLDSLIGGGNSSGYPSSSNSSGVSGGNSGVADYSVSKLARDRYYTPVGNGKDTVTVMVYMCGTDLESKYAMASKDLNEMLAADISDKINLIVETGGCSRWQNNIVSSSVNQIYKLGHKSMTAVEENFGKGAMTDPENLAKFIQYCGKNYPADRNILIFWDHGGGSLSGYGYDEKYPNSPSMTLGKINEALKDGGLTFDFIGFDACLMATLETDLVCNGYADYMIASEESEPGTGWYYTGWLNKLSQNSSVSTVDLGKQIVDDFVAASCSASSQAQVTLSVVDLAELEGTVPEAMSSFATATNKLVKSDDYQLVSNARAGARQFAKQSRLNQVDLVDFADRMGTAEAKNLCEALLGCVKYNKSTISRSNGISIYFPYETKSSVNNAVSTLNDLSEEADYTECMADYKSCIQSFASLQYGGQIASSASTVGSAGSSMDWGSLLGSLINSSATTTTSSSGSPIGSLTDILLGSSGSSSPIGSLAGSLLGSSGSSSSSPIGSLAGSLLGASGSSSSSPSIDPSSIISLLGAFSGRSMPAELSWVDTELIADRASEIAQSTLDPARIAATSKDGTPVLELTQEEWALIQTAELNVFASDGEGYFDLGLDNTFDWYDDDSLLLSYDGTWLTLNGNVCTYYLLSDTQQEDGSWVTVGRIPALLNGMEVNLQVVFDDAHPEGTVTGAYPMSEDSLDVQAKGDIAIEAGDEITLIGDYYGLDGTYQASYTMGTFKVSDAGLRLENLKINAEGFSAMYRLTDVYGNYFWVKIP